MIASRAPVNFYKVILQFVRGAQLNRRGGRWHDDLCFSRSVAGDHGGRASGLRKRKQRQNAEAICCRQAEEVSNLLHSFYGLLGRGR